MIRTRRGRPRTAEYSVVIGTVYLLHYTGKVRGSLHYLGFTEQDVQRRLAEHNSGVFGSQMSNLAVKLGYKAILVKVWERVPVNLEKRLKRQKNLKKHCSICRAERLQRLRPVPPSNKDTDVEAG